MRPHFVYASRNNMYKFLLISNNLTYLKYIYRMTIALNFAGYKATLSIYTSTYITRKHTAFNSFA